MATENPRVKRLQEIIIALRKKEDYDHLPIVMADAIEAIRKIAQKDLHLTGPYLLSFWLGAMRAVDRNTIMSIDTDFAADYVERKFNAMQRDYNNGFSDLGLNDGVAAFMQLNKLGDEFATTAYRGGMEASVNLPVTRRQIANIQSQVSDTTRIFLIDPVIRRQAHSLMRDVERQRRIIP